MQIEFSIQLFSQEACMKKIITYAGLLAIYATAPAFANDMDGDHQAKMKAMTESFFKKMDTNNDGYISKDEHRAFSDKMFEEADANHDGKISMDELSAFKQKEHDEWKTKMGWNKPKVNEDTKTNADPAINNTNKN